MSHEVTLPVLGESVVEGTVSRWLKKVGDTVVRDEPLVEISTDKVDTEIPSPVAGVLTAIRVHEDETVVVGTVLAIIGDASVEAPAPVAEIPPTVTPYTPPEVPVPPVAPVQPEPVVPVVVEPAPVVEPVPAVTPEPVPVVEPVVPNPAPVPANETPVVPVVVEPTPVPELTAPEPAPAPEPTPAPAPEPVQAEPVDEVEEPELEEDPRTVVVPQAPVAEVLGIVPSPQVSSIAQHGIPESIGSSVYVTPLVRKLAEETGVDLNTLVGSGVGGRIRKQDVLDAAGTPDPSEPDLVEEVQPDVPVATSEVDEVEESKEQVDMPEFIAPEDQPEASEDDLAETGLVEPEVADAEGTDAEGEDSNEKVEEESVEDTDAQKAEAAEIEEVAEVDLDEFDSDDMPEDEDREEHIEETAEDLVDEVEDKDDSEDVAVLESINIALEAERGEQHPISGSTEKISRLRATIARRMVDSLQNSAQLTATVEVDLTLISRLRSQVKDDFKAREGVSLTFLPFIAKAAIEALRAYPKVNARMDTEAGEIVYPKGVHLAIAVDTPKGLLVPVIKSAGDLTVSGLAKKIADLSARTRSNEITPDELQGGTFTITNYGSAGTLFDTPIVNQPQVAILGTGSIKRRPVVVDDPRLGEIIAIRDMMYLSLSYDHRLVDGADAARFLVMVKERLEGGDFGAQF